MNEALTLIEKMSAILSPLILFFFERGLAS